MTDGTLILLYHRVARAERDPHGLAVEPQRFAEQLASLKGLGNVLPLTQAQKPVAGNRVAITFDDGYVDNAHEARPILDDAGLPATFFVTAGRLGHTVEFWWDRLEHLLLGSDLVGDAIDVDIEGRRLWVDVRSPSGRERAHWALYWRLKPLPLPAITATLDAVQRQLGVHAASRPEYRMMTIDDLRDIAGSERHEIGGHTLTHPLLARQPPEAQRKEIAGCRQVLEQLTGRVVTSFAYPFGGPDALDDVTAGLVRDAGYERACTATGGFGGPTSDPLRLPRRVVGDWDAQTFAAHVRRWLSSSAGP